MPALRGLRGSVVGLSAAVLGLLGHAMAGGALPSTTVVVLATGGLVLLGVSMSGRTWGLPSLLTVLVGAQLGLHVTLAGSAPQQMDAMPGMAHQGVVPGLAMTGVHLGAAVVAAALLRRGERWCCALVDLLGRPLRAIALVVLPVPRPRPLSAHPAPAGSRTRHLSPGLSRRGPPALSPA
jgi:hypothetical protein